MTSITYIYHFKSPKTAQKPLIYYDLMAFYKLGRQRPQMRKDSGLIRVLGTSTHATGMTNLGTLEGEHFMNYNELLRILQKCTTAEMKTADGNHLLNYQKRQLT